MLNQLSINIERLKDDSPHSGSSGFRVTECGYTSDSDTFAFVYLYAQM